VKQMASAPDKFESSKPSVFIHEGTRAAARLAELGLTEEILVRVVQEAEMERRSCSPLEPTIAPGFKAWVTAVRVAAELLMPRDWIQVESKGLPRILNPDTKVAIAIVGGDEATGRITGPDPKSKTPRGAQSAFLVRSNEHQLAIPFAEGKRFRPLPDDKEQITWWLLIYSDGISALRAELSLPVGLGEDSRLSRWQERIILAVPDLSLDFLGGRDDEEPPIELEVNVRSRS
jgi:hypothetical protein